MGVANGTSYYNINSITGECEMVRRLFNQMRTKEGVRECVRVCVDGEKASVVL